MEHLIFCVTNDLSYDQRMYRICSTLATAGFRVRLVGRSMRDSVPLEKCSFTQKRLRCFFSRGIAFYGEYNIRLFFYLLRAPKATMCAIDLDTILAVYLASVWRRSKRVYDAHELFTEQKEVVTRKYIHACWMAIERFAVPRFRHGYTVNDMLARIFSERYGVSYQIIPNFPLLAETPEPTIGSEEKFFLYQGAVNEGRCFETLIPAMQLVPARLLICGTGNFMEQTLALVKKYRLEDKISFTGKLLPEELKQITRKAYAGIMLFEGTGLNQYYSLANRFFDYIMAGIPQLCVNYPLYAAINETHDIMLPITDTSVETIAAGLNELLNNPQRCEDMRRNCILARKQLNWEQVAPKLVTFYKTI